MTGLNEAILTLMNAGKAMGATTLPEKGEPFVIVPSPEGYKPIGVGKFYEPTHVQAMVSADTPESFADYVNLFKIEDTMIFACVGNQGATITAVIDYHLDAVTPRRCAHWCTCKLAPTVEWNRWMAANGVPKAQLDFAEFLEENQDLITSPPGAELLELVQTLEGKNHVRFNSAVRLPTGRISLAYEEDVELRGGVTPDKGKVEMPPIITAGIAPFEGLDKYLVTARLRWRIADRKITFFLNTVNPHRIVRDAVNGVLAMVEEKTMIKPILGAYQR